MARNSYSAEFKTKLVLELLQGDKDVNALATQHTEINFRRLPSPPPHKYPEYAQYQSNNPS